MNDKSPYSELKTLVFGASLKSHRYSHMATMMLRNHHVPTVAVGGRQGKIGDVEVLTGHPTLEHIHTVTMYMGEKRAAEHIDYLLSLQPKRFILNPGAENDLLTKLARSKGIEVLEACTLVLLRTHQYWPTANKKI